MFVLIIVNSVLKTIIFELFTSQKFMKLHNNYLKYKNISDFKTKNNLVEHLKPFLRPLLRETDLKHKVFEKYMLIQSNLKVFCLRKLF